MRLSSLPDQVPILQDTHRGLELRKLALLGQLPAEWAAALGDERFARLQSMWRRKVGTTEAFYGDLLREITESEWEEVWARRSRKSSASASGMGLSH